MRRVLSVGLAVLVGACGNPDPDSSTSEPGVDTTAGTPVSAIRSELVRRPDSEGSPRTTSSAAPAPVEVLFLGTSLTEGLGLDRPSQEAWPARIAVLADSAGIPIAATNAGLGGDTSAGALRRLEWVMRQEPDVLVVETGANDGLRGLPVDQLEANLDEIMRWVQSEYPDVLVLLSQMEAPPSLGADYTAAFSAVYPRVADRWSVELIPFLLEGVAAIPELNQRDGIHPTPEGHWLMARNAWSTLESSFRAALR